MNNAILVHGWSDLAKINDPMRPTPSNGSWLPWLTKQLFMKKIFTVAIEMPIADLPIYEDWKKEFERYDVGPETTLVGHSCGAGFLVRWLGENPHIKIDKLILVAPSLGLSWEDRSFFDFEIDPELHNRVEKISIFVANDDRDVIQEAVKVYQTKIPSSKTIILEKGGHLTFSDMQTEEFPELLQEILR